MRMSANAAAPMPIPIFSLTELLVRGTLLLVTFDGVTEVAEVVAAEAIVEETGSNVALLVILK